MANPESLFPMDESDEVALEISIGGLRFVLTHANTEMYTYRRWPEVNHIYHTYREDGDDKQIAIFDCPDMIAALRDMNFGERVLPRPSVWDEQAFMEHQRKKLDEDLEEL